MDPLDRVRFFINEISWKGKEQYGILAIAEQKQNQAKAC